MISSGKKRGLAAVAVSALAVAGLPFLASSASAADPMTMSVVLSGPARNGGNQGALVVLSAKNVPASALSGASGHKTMDFFVESPSGTESTQSVSVVDGEAEWQGADSGGSGYLAVHVATQTTTLGATASYTLYADSDISGDVTVGDARVNNSTTTAGDPAKILVSPTSQVAASDVWSNDYTATVVDSGNRTTQLNNDEVVNFVGTPSTTSLKIRNPLPGTDGSYDYDQIGEIDGGAPAAFAPLPADALPMGTLAFQAKDTRTDATSVDIPINLTKITTPADMGTTPPTPPVYETPSVTAKANLVIIATASGLTEDDVDVVTDADTWDGFGGGSFEANPPVSPGEYTGVRVDQKSIRIDIADDDTTVPAPNGGKTVVLKVEGGNGVTFGGKSSTSYTTVLNSDGQGSITVTPDAGSITAGGTIYVSGSDISIPLEFQRSKVESVEPDASAYVSKFGGSTDVTLTALDQFDLPAAGAYVGVQRTGPVNTDATITKKAVDANGQATFTLTDTKATAPSSDTLATFWYEDQYDPSATAGPTAKINYTEDGQGGDFALSADLSPVASPVYDPAGAASSFAPLTNAVEDGSSATGVPNGDDVVIGITGGTANAPVTIAVDNDALVLPTGKSNLTDGKASLSTKLGSSGEGNWKIVGTKTGTVTVTVTSGGRTKTAQVTVKAADPNNTTARNISVSGPEKANANDVVTFTAVITDAFGNPVKGYDPNSTTGEKITPTLIGPAQVLSNSGKSDANGQITYQVQLSNSASSPVTLQLNAAGDQFGANADRVTAAANNAAANGPGLTASNDTASATISQVKNLAELQAAVDAAQAKVDNAQDALDVAKGEKKVAKTEKKVAKKDVKAAKKALKKAKKHHKGVKAAKKNLRQARGANQVAMAKVQVAKKKVKVAKQRLADAQAELAAAQQELEDAQNNG